MQVTCNAVDCPWPLEEDYNVTRAISEDRDLPIRPETFFRGRRFAANSLATELACAVCMESMSVADAPSQLPCAHFMCTVCMKKLFPIDKRGLKCPSCQREHRSWSFQRHEAAPGGVVIVEHLEGR